MFVALAALLLHFPAVPQNMVSRAVAVTIETSDTVASAKPSAGAQMVSSNSTSEGPLSEEVSTKPDPQPNSAAALIPGRAEPGPAAPATSMPLAAASFPSLPILQASTPLLSLSSTAADSKLTHHRLWLALDIAQHGAATFDAASTRNAISSGKCYEVDPLIRPFAGNASIYVVIQVGPALLDYLGHRMMTSENSWARHTWWIPQTAGTAMSFISGVHNLDVRSDR